MGVDRRTFLKGGVGTRAALALSGPFQGFLAHAAHADPLGSMDRLVRSWTWPTA